MINLIVCVCVGGGCVGGGVCVCACVREHAVFIHTFLGTHDPIVTLKGGYAHSNMHIFHF